MTREATSTAPGSLSARAVTGEITVTPDRGPVRFGRNKPDVEICIGEDDLLVSRQHGVLTHRSGRWWVTNLGRTPIRMTNFMMLYSRAEPVPLGSGRTPLYLRGSDSREHVLELFVAGAEGGTPPPRYGYDTVVPRPWCLDEEERLAVVVVGQNYLLNEPQPRPLARQSAADLLNDLRPDDQWSDRRVERVIARVRTKLSNGGVPFLMREELEEPIGNSLTENLMRELVQSTTLTPSDLDLLDG
ncbi:hypothetical protein EV193_11119 [Herbihabitans rhizosphaerae]|uniref:FHA domain-containing protein n=1 Tax=Herbihabitans rhizosphaerae TaxID=1872711 RepID=A0A4Q7KFG4_9PSEU|nr:FHA domain-containing protein [Herbihabitans rhizosphaerae]RZS32643.1 hypothetical protein EV193_11119 [Herbihabitans rhizosphaerae]